MTYAYDLAVIIGRFQPLHLGHLSLFRQAARLAPRCGVLLGSAERSRNIENPFIVAERRIMIEMALEETAAEEDVALPMLAFEGVNDFLYNDQRWAVRVQTCVASILQRFGLEADARICLVGHRKDASTEAYLKMFPQWETHSAPAVDVLSATDIRRHWLDVPGDLPDVSGIQDPEHAELVLTSAIQRALEGPDAVGRMAHLRANLKPSTIAMLLEFQKRPEFARLVEERCFIRQYRRQFASLPYPPTFQTVDAVVVQSGHVLLVRRRAMPGKGLWALPGGFVHPTETLRSAMMRELREETRLKIPEPVLRGSIRAHQVFDYPKRSLRGRTFTQAYFIMLADGPLPPVKGGDDALKARWFPISEVAQMSAMLFEDHYDILDYFVGLG